MGRCSRYRRPPNPGVYSVPRREPRNRRYSDTVTCTMAEVQQHWKPLPPTPVESRASARSQYSPGALKLAVVRGF